MRGFDAHPAAPWDWAWITGYPDVIPLQVRPTLMTVCVVLASLVPILQETGAGADVMKCIVASIMGGTKLQEIQTCYYIFVTVLVDSGYVPRKNFPFNSFRTPIYPSHPRHSVMSRMLYPYFVIGRKVRSWTEGTANRT
jgi:hypothetical protein